MVGSLVESLDAGYSLAEVAVLEAQTVVSEEVLELEIVVPQDPIAEEEAAGIDLDILQSVVEAARPILDRLELVVAEDSQIAVVGHHEADSSQTSSLDVRGKKVRIIE